MELSSFLYGLYKLAKYGVYPLSWLFLLLGLLTVLVALPISPRRLRWIRSLTVASLLLVFGLGSPIAPRLLVGLLEEQSPPFDTATTKRYDAIVVLGGGAAGKGTLRPSDELSPDSIERTICGAALFTQGFAPRMIFSGGDGSIFGEGPKEGVEMKRLALRLGVPEEAAVVEDRSRTTYENAVETKRILGNGSILMVTSSSHVPRALDCSKTRTRYHPTPAVSRAGPAGGWTLGDPFDLLPKVEELQKSTSRSLSTGALSPSGGAKRHTGRLISIAPSLDMPISARWWLRASAL
jgi:uncharacterized SAM-binding protein YcdF (DUF218 family)